MPIVTQAYASVSICQMLSNLDQPINVFRYNNQPKTIDIQAGSADEIAIIIDEEGI